MLYVSMTDKFLSGWGKAEGKTAKMVILCKDWKQALAIERNAKKRSEMKYINICINKPRYGESYQVTWRKFAELGEIWKK